MAEFKIGDKVEHIAVPGFILTVIGMEPDGLRMLLLCSDPNGRKVSRWAHECKLISSKPEGSWITW